MIHSTYSTISIITNKSEGNLVIFQILIIHANACPGDIIASVKLPRLIIIPIKYKTNNTTDAKNVWDLIIYSAYFAFFRMIWKLKRKIISSSLSTSPPLYAQQCMRLRSKVASIKLIRSFKTYGFFRGSKFILQTFLVSI